MIKELKVFIPANITGFFEIIDDPNPALKGSKGAGITLDSGVTTHTKIKDGCGRVCISTNGEINDLNTVTSAAVDIICEKFNVDLSCYDILIEHVHDFPISAGFGSSAGFALGVSFTLPKLLGINLSYNQAGEIAHLAEIRLSSGLGDVIASLNGGCVMRLKPGSPVNGIIDKIPTTQPIYVISKTIGLLQTDDIIDDPVYKKCINENASHLLNCLIKDPCIENYIKLSRRFAENTKLITPQLHEILEIMDDETIGSSMAMLGNTAYALSYTPDISIEDCHITTLNTTGIKYL